MSRSNQPAPPNNALQRTRSAPLRSPLSLKTFGDQARGRVPWQAAIFFLTVYGLPILHLSDSDRRSFLKDDFAVVATTTKIPQAVLKRFAEITKTKGIPFAEPGAKWQVTDVITRPELPRRRLFFAGTSESLCFIHYEMGGIGRAEYLVIFRLWEKPELIYKAVCRRAARNLTQLRDELRQGRLRDDPDYYF